VAEVRREITRSGTYRHTAAELEHGAWTAWRNSRALHRPAALAVSWCVTRVT